MPGLWGAARGHGGVNGGHEGWPRLEEAKGDGAAMREMRSLATAKRELCGNDPTPERLQAAERVAELSKSLRDDGWVERAWRPGKLTPMSKRGPSGWEWAEMTERWIDHQYRLVNKAEGVELFISEPYGVRGAWKDFQALEEQGWDVYIDARLALHSPGSTVAIVIQRVKEPLDRERVRGSNARGSVDSDTLQA